jgi:hypothetical protein
MRKEAQRMVRTLDRRLSVSIGLEIGGAFATGAMLTLAVVFLAGVRPLSAAAETSAAWRDLVTEQSHPRGAMASATVMTDRAGRRFCSGMRLWLDPAE